LKRLPKKEEKKKSGREKMGGKKPPTFGKIIEKVIKVSNPSAR